MKQAFFTLRGKKRAREIVSANLGKLEREALEEIWRRGEASVREICDAFDGRLAYTTLMTTLDRLYKKNLLSRRKEGRAFLYAPRLSREEMERSIVAGLISSLLSRNNKSANAEPILACIVDTVTERDRALLDELESLVRAKRNELQSASEAASENEKRGGSETSED